MGSKSPYLSLSPLSPLFKALVCLSLVQGPSHLWRAVHRDQG